MKPQRSLCALRGTSIRSAVVALISTCCLLGPVSAVSDEWGGGHGTPAPVDRHRSRGFHPLESGDVVLDWVEQAFETVRSERVGTPAAGRLYAMTFAAMFDAVNGINRQRFRGRLHALVPPRGAPRRADRTAAAAVAAHTVLSGLVPAAADALDDALEQSLAGRRGRWRVEAGLAWGRHVGARVLSIRASDGTAIADEVAPASTKPGVFRTTFDRRYANMTPFAIQSDRPYRLVDPPPALTSGEYADSQNRVFVEGSEADTDLERLDIALQWETPGGTIRPTGSAIQAAVALVRSRQSPRRITSTARLFALIGMSVADTIIPVWHGKAHFFTWRPAPAIQRAREDGNPDTTFDPDLTTRFGSIGGSPEYPSGQAAFSAAVARVLEIFYRDRRLSWCFSSDSNSDGRCYDSARQMADEAGESRIYQGVHFPFTVVASRQIGRGVATEVARSALRGRGPSRTDPRHAALRR